MSEANSKLSEQEIEGGPNVTVTDPEESVTATPKENVKDTDSSNDPYAYLERDFSSENFKIKIKNLPKCYGIHEFQKLLNEKLNLNSSKLKTLFRNSPYAFVCFRSIEDRENAIKVLNDYKWKGKSLVATRAKPMPDPLVKKRKEMESDTTNKKIKVDTRSKNQEEILKSSTIPLWNTPYEQQLTNKQEGIKKILRKLANNIIKSNILLKDHINSQKALYDNLPCQLDDIRCADVITGYRNKCEFTVGIDKETNLPTVGFRIGSYANGTTGVGPIDTLLSIPDSMKTAVKLFQEFVRKSELKPFDPELQTGHFRQLTVRTATDQLMLIVGIHPQDLSQEQVQRLKNELVEYFSQGPGLEAKATSLYYLEMRKKTSNEDRVHPEHLMGETHVYETILGLKFRFSPDSFFQINTAGAEVLYKTVIELANPTEQSTVVDVCCGTGTIGLCFAKSCAQVLGVEIVPQAVVDAKENAKINNIENSEFFTGKAEDILYSVICKATSNDVIAVVDPPRAGLHQKAITQLRNSQKINRLVYIACNPAAACKNFADLGRPLSKTLHGQPFVPVKAVAVDMFPYTQHCELVVCFERVNLL